MNRVIITISLIFILVGKNHDDFYYYHFPYILNLTEFPHQIGLGNLNHGFKTHSSIFLLNSMFHLPGTNYNLFHLGVSRSQLVYFFYRNNVIVYFQCASYFHSKIYQAIICYLTYLIRLYIP